MVLSIKHKFWANKRNVWRRRFFYTHQKYVLYSHVLFSNPSVSKTYFILVSIPKSFKFEFAKFYHIHGTYVKSFDINTLCDP